jgi:hypothetical protein
MTKKKKKKKKKKKTKGESRKQHCRTRFDNNSSYHGVDKNENKSKIFNNHNNSPVTVQWRFFPL